MLHQILKFSVPMLKLLLYLTLRLWVRFAHITTHPLAAHTSPASELICTETRYAPLISFYVNLITLAKSQHNRVMCSHGPRVRSDCRKQLTESSYYALLYGLYHVPSKLAGFASLFRFILFFSHWRAATAETYGPGWSSSLKLGNHSLLQQPQAG